MEEIAYKDMINQEKHHWWFKARREILNSFLMKMNLSKNSDILEIGCGTGGNLKMLKKYGNVQALEMDSFAIDHAKHYGVEVREGSLPDKFIYDKKFDLICLFDVLEHIKDDEESLKIICKHLKPSGKLLMSVPAHQWLYGSHDKILHHKRRYSKNEIVKKINAASLKISRISYFNTLLFPLVIISRLIDMIKKEKKSLGYNIPSKIINNLFYTIFKFEKVLLNSNNLPFGTSLICIVKKY